VRSSFASAATIVESLDRHVFPQNERALQACFRVHVGIFTGPNAVRDLRAGNLNAHRAGQRIVVGLLVLLQVSYIAPVVGCDEAEERLAVAQHERKDILGEVVTLPGFHVLEDFRFEHVDAGVDGIGEHFAPRRLLKKAGDAGRVVGDDHAELQRIRHALQRDRALRPVPFVKREECAEIHIGQCVAGDDDEALARQVLFGELDGACGSERRILDDVVHLDAHLRTVAEIVLDFVG
jgi:hypothetical protein